MKQDAILYKLSIELTERCNNNCVHCYINLPPWDKKAKEKELSTDKIKEILKEAVSLGCLDVKFTGGEPLLREDFEEIYIFARKLGLRVIIFTNATLITPSLARLFKSYPPLRKIEITLYGEDKDSYEKITRRAGSYKECIRGINLLEENKIPFVIKSFFLSFDEDRIKKFKNYIKNFSYFSSSKPISFPILYLRARRDDGKKNALIKKLRLSPQEILKFDIYYDIYYKGKFTNIAKQFFKKFAKIGGTKLFRCGAGLYGGCVDAYGNFQPCLMLRHPECVYELKKGSLKDALLNFFPKTRELEAKNEEYLKKCAHCFLRSWCHQCPATSWMETGSLDTPVEYFCKITHIQARYLGLLKENENAWEVKNWRERVDKFLKGGSVYAKSGVG